VREADDIIQILSHFRGTQLLSRPQAAAAGEPENLRDLKDIKGQESAKCALEVAATGGHHMLRLETRRPSGKEKAGGPQCEARRAHRLFPPVSCQPAV
jgi:predicted ATPase with chaperone activity